MDIACIDLEGVLIPELWPHVSKACDIPELARTTREEPHYPRLVEFRIRTLRKHGLRLTDLQLLVSKLAPLPGAKEFLHCLREQMRVVLVSDAFEQMVAPFCLALGKPELRCNRFTCDAEGYISSALYARVLGKHEVIEEYAAQGLSTLAVGDAFNDLSMLRQASKGFLFRPSLPTRLAAQDLVVAASYREILDALDLRIQTGLANMAAGAIVA